VFLTWGVCYEFLRVATHPKVFPRPWSMPAALEFVGTLQRSRGVQMLTPTERHAAVLAQTVAEMPALQGNDAHDLHTAVLMREHGISRICTRDAGFRRFAFLTPFDPMMEVTDGR
jgi:predicted nucleic acid-binding protein